MEAHGARFVGNALGLTMGLRNIGIAATVGSAILTVALKGADGNDPSATNPVVIAFRDETLTTGTPNVRTVTAETHCHLSSGSTLGFTAALAGRIYIWAIDNAGTVELALSRTADIFPESNLVSTTAEGGAGAADSATVMYSTTARTNVACRCIGYIEITTGATAGEWDNAPTKIQIMGPGVKRTGDVVQIRQTSSGAVVTGTTALPKDDTIPQITEGDQLFSLAIVPTSTINTLTIEALVHIDHSVNDMSEAIALFQDATANALCVGGIYTYNGAARLNNVMLTHYMVSGTTSSTTFTLRFGAQTGSTSTINGSAGGRLYGGVLISFLKITEVMV